MTDATDDFNRAALGTNWTQGMNSIVISASTVAKGNTAADENTAWWNANTFASNHYSQIELRADADGGGPLVRHQSGANTFYVWASDGAVITMFESTAGTFAALGASYALNTVVGDVLKLDMTGTTLTPSLNAAAQATRTDASISGGAPGIHCFSTTMSLDNWLGGPISDVLNTAWFRPSEQIWRSRAAQTETRPALALTPATLPPKIAGMAWFVRQADIPPPKRPLHDFRPAINLTPATLPPKIAGMAFLAIGDRDKPPTKVRIESPPAWEPQIITVAVAAPPTGWFDPLDIFWPRKRVIDEPAEVVPAPAPIILTPLSSQDVLQRRWIRGSEPHPLVMPPVVDVTPVSGIAWFEPLDDLPRKWRRLSDVPSFVNPVETVTWSFMCGDTVWIPDPPRSIAPSQIFTFQAPVGISGMAWFAPPDRDRPRSRPIVEASPAWGPQFVFQVEPPASTGGDDYIVWARRRGRR